MALTKVSTDGVKDDAVTTDKLANAINTERTANTAKDLTALSASNLTSGTIPDARLPATLPAISGANLTGISTAHRNKIYNGKMEIDQRNSGASTNIEGNSTKYHIDRFAIDGVSLDELSAGVQRVDEAPDGSGFVRSLKITTNTPESSIAANELVYLSQRLEGQDLQDLIYNTSSAKAVTMSFWVRSSITGTYGFTVYRDEPGTDRIVNKTYTINSANTWERKTITIAGDTGRAIQNTNGSVWWNVWHLASGSNFDSSTSSTWANYATTNWAGGHAQDGVITTNGATWQITGVQLEVGSVATDFEHLSFADELRRCQRYFFNITGDTGSRSGIAAYANSTSSLRAIVQFPVPMRATPTFSGTATAMIMDSSDDSDSFNISGFANGGAPTTSNPSRMCLDIGTGGMTAGQGGQLEFRANNGEMNFSSEL